jgi:hypothetical protein
MSDFYLDLILNYSSNYNNIIELPTKLYDEDLFSILALNDIYVDTYFFHSAFLDNLPDFIHHSVFKKIFLFFFYIFFYTFAFLALIRLLIIDFSPHTGLFNLSQFYFEFEHNVGNGEDLLMIISLILAVVL